jgi:DNA recombination protein RmuC
MDLEFYILAGALAVVIILLIVLILRRAPMVRSAVDGERYNSQMRELRELQKQISALKVETEKIIIKQGAEDRDKLFENLNAQTARINETLQKAVGSLQESNEKKLDQMRQTVDEKLTETLRSRLDESFKTVGEQLKNVYETLGEMKKLSGGVSDLQRLLTNVKARGTWAEIQLGEILEQTLPQESFCKNVSTKGNSERVEFAVKIPSREKDGEEILLPIDSKFPQEDYLRLQAAAERSDPAAVEESAKALERIIKSEAKTISELYINVPKTTDFAIMFLPTEGLYSEVLRRPGLTEELQRRYRVIVCGPTTVTAFLNTLQMGFRTIALDKRASQVWELLGAARQQYETFAAVLEKAKRKIDEAGNVIESAQKRNGIIYKKLKSVDSPSADKSDFLIEDE